MQNRIIRFWIKDLEVHHFLKGLSWGQGAAMLIVSLMIFFLIPDAVSRIGVAGYELRDSTDPQSATRNGQTGQLSSLFWISGQIL